ncbi:MAG: hypothetical protein FWF61_01975, partial [Brevinematales bacterium]|nr:hypothetical protein [Brevinematales bacterium]
MKIRAFFLLLLMTAVLGVSQQSQNDDGFIEKPISENDDDQSIGDIITENDDDWSVEKPISENNDDRS